MNRRQTFRSAASAAGLAGLALLAAGQAVAAPPPAAPPEALRPLLQCRAETDPAARLKCYDAQVAALADAAGRNDVLVADRRQVQQARRSVFGLSLPSLSFLSGRDRDEKGGGELDEISAKIVTAKLLPYGKWRFVLDDGARWMQTEPHEFPRDPAAGMPIRIRKAAGGSYLANVDGQTAVRVQRER